MTGPVEGPTLAEVVSSYGDIESKPLSRIQAFTAKAMSRNWSTIPHVTHFDSMDMTALEAARRRANADRAPEDRLSPLAYLLKAVAGVLEEIPRFNAALDPAANTLLLRKYVNLGVAIDTPAGLVVGVVRGCDKLSIGELSAQTKALGEKARSKGLSLTEMSGAGFTVSSLGNLGGDGFTPIINAPEVAILGVSRMNEAPRRAEDGGLEWRSLLPVCLSYDHRAVNGADAGRFMQALQAQVDRLATD
ncbi:MAG TPA: 2-oxo acid dehydrogenase subunit E2 [Caulobacteraceae bacterium]|jgi:pyruvate dehydrogenase E2 component (dihydrolipoamide acetyltransferase)|nr:2-oxo acid dehydrogenase subunit E2 [Caulobacteraceae bacterium]